MSHKMQLKKQKQSFFSKQNLPKNYPFFFFFILSGPINCAEHVIQGLQKGYAGWKNQNNIHLVCWCLPGRELTTLGHES